MRAQHIFMGEPNHVRYLPPHPLGWCPHSRGKHGHLGEGVLVIPAGPHVLVGLCLCLYRGLCLWGR